MGANDAYDDLLKINPLGQIPTLVLPDGTVLSESAAILIHLGGAHPASGLLPRRRRARRCCAASCSSRPTAMPRSASSTIPSAGARTPTTPTRKRIRAGTRARLHRYWEMFADLFPARPYLGGEPLGALDLLAAVVSKWSGTRAHLQQARPALHETLLRIEAHPQVAPVFARHWPAS